jgi:hypothetical protein
MLTGIRASESLLRFQSVMNKKNESYICGTKSEGIKLCKPIYDWSEQDVFLYFYQRGINYCPIYDEQMWNREALRVSSSLNAEAAKQFNKLATRCPHYYQQVLDLFPEMIVQSRYYKDVKNNLDFSAYARSIDGLKKFAIDTISDERLLAGAMKIISFVEGLRSKTTPTAANKYCGYPLMYVFEQLAKGGSLKRGTLLPCPTLKKAYIDFENGE